MEIYNSKFKEYIEELADGKREIILPKNDFNVRDVTVTNVMETEKSIYANCHFLFGYDDGSELFSTNLGYKICYLKTHEAKMDLYYVSGNDYLFKDFKVTKEKTIDNEPLLNFSTNNNQDIISVFGWMMDTGDINLARKCCDPGIYIERAGVNGEIFVYDGIEKINDFLEFDCEYYKPRSYSLVVESEKGNNVLAYHLFPANTGNKHLGSNTRYVQFFNEDVLFTISNNKISKVVFKRKERPIVKRDRIIII